MMHKFAYTCTCTCIHTCICTFLPLLLQCIQYVDPTYSVYMKVGFLSKFSVWLVCYAHGFHVHLYIQCTCSGSFCKEICEHCKQITANINCTMLNYTWLLLVWSLVSSWFDCRGLLLNTKFDVTMFIRLMYAFRFVCRIRPSQLSCLGSSVGDTLRIHVHVPSHAFKPNWCKCMHVAKHLQSVVSVNTTSK